MDIRKLRDIFKRYQQGTSNETENALVEAWYNSYKANEQDLDDKDAARIRKDILTNIRQATGAGSKVVSFRVLKMVAAVLVFITAGLLTWLVINRTQARYTLVATQTNELKEISLPDGSKVWLNSASRISVPSVFKGDNREVSLEEGEAFFNVTKDSKHPFIVRTPHVNVRVLGTSFDVKAYGQSRHVNVSVTTGKVAVSTSQKLLATLIPGQQLDFNIDNGASLVKSVNTTEINSWQKGTTYLSEASFAELCVAVKSIYGISLKAGSKKIEGFHFNMRLMHSLTQQQVLELISQIHQTKVRKEGNAVILY